MDRIERWDRDTDHQITKYSFHINLIVILFLSILNLLDFDFIITAIIGILILCVPIFLALFSDITNDDFEYYIAETFKSKRFHECYLVLRIILGIIYGCISCFLIIAKFHNLNLFLQLMCGFLIIFVPRISVTWFQKARYSVWTRIFPKILRDFQINFENNNGQSILITKKAIENYEKSEAKRKLWASYPLVIRMRNFSNILYDWTFNFKTYVDVELMKREIPYFKIEEFAPPILTIDSEYFFKEDIIMIKNIDSLRNLPIMIQMDGSRYFTLNFFGGESITYSKDELFKMDIEHATLDQTKQYFYSMEKEAEMLFKILHLQYLGTKQINLFKWYF